MTKLQYVGLIPEVGVDQEIEDNNGDILFRDYCGNPDDIA
jgi:hypothetical protein